MSKTIFNYNTPVPANWFNTINGARLRFDGNNNDPNSLVDGQYLPLRLQDLDPAIFSETPTNATAVLRTTDQTIDGNKQFLQPVKVPNALTADQAVNKSQLDAVNNNVVHLTGNEIIAGVKTFNSSPIAPAGVNANDVVIKSQLDAIATSMASLDAARIALDAAVVKLTTAQTIAGVKTFTSSPLIPPGSTPGAAVNYAQLLGSLPTPNQYGSNYLIFPNGLKFQWGQINLNGVFWTVAGNYIGDQHGYTTYFSPAFTNTPTVTISIANTVRTGDWGSGINLNIINLTNTQFDWYGDAIGGSYIGDGKINWMAIGY